MQTLLRLVVLWTSTALATTVAGQEAPNNPEVKELFEKLKSSGIHCSIWMEAPKPLLIRGHPAVVIVAGDEHRKDWQKLNAEILQKIQSKLSIRTLAVEGHSFNSKSEKEALQLYQGYFQKLKELTHTTQSLSRYINRPVPFVERLDSSPFEYRKMVKFTRYFGIESRQPRDEFRRLVLSELLIAFREICAVLAKGESFNLTVADQATNAYGSRLIAARTMLESEGFIYPLESVITQTTYTLADGTKFKVQEIRPDQANTVKDWYLRYVATVFSPRVLTDRNMIQADNIRSEMTRHHERTIAVVDGWSHLFENLNTQRTLGEILANQCGISVLYVMPWEIDHLSKEPDGKIVPVYKKFP